MFLLVVLFLFVFVVNVVVVGLWNMIYDMVYDMMFIYFIVVFNLLKFDSGLYWLYLLYKVGIFSLILWS